MYYVISINNFGRETHGNQKEKNDFIGRQKLPYYSRFVLIGLILLNLKLVGLSKKKCHI